MNDAQRLADCWGISLDDADFLLSLFTIQELMPEGGGLPVVTGQVVGYTMRDMAVALTAVEESIEFGQKARLQICADSLPTEDELDTWYLGMVEAGFHCSRPVGRVVDGVATVELVIRKGSPIWALLIPIIPAILIIGLVTFGVTRIGTITGAILPIVIVLGATVVLSLFALRKPAAAVATRYIEGKKFASTVKPGGMPPGAPPIDWAQTKTSLEQRVRLMWLKATNWEDIPPESKFVVFSIDNPYLEDYNRLVGELMEGLRPQTKEKDYIRILSTGGTIFNIGDLVSLDTFEKENERVHELGGRSAHGDMWDGEKYINLPQTISEPEEYYEGFIKINVEWYKKNMRKMEYNEYIKLAQAYFKTQEELRQFVEWAMTPRGREVYNKWMRLGALSVKGFNFPQLLEREKGGLPDNKPTKLDVDIETWVERDRIGIWINDRRTGKTIAEWWDEQAREMFEQGWFKAGDIRAQTMTGRAFEESVLDYLEDTGVLAKEDLPQLVEKACEPKLEYFADSPEYLAQTVDMTGWRQKINEAFKEAIARARSS